MEYLSLIFSIIALLISTLALWYSRRESALSSYRSLIDDFNEIIQAAVDDKDVLDIYENLFYQKEIRSDLDNSAKQRWAYLRVLNIFEKHFIEAKSGFVRRDIITPILDEMMTNLLANENFYQTFKMSHYTKGFVEYVEMVRRKSFEPPVTGKAKNPRV